MVASSLLAALLVDISTVTVADATVVAASIVDASVVAASVSAALVLAVSIVAVSVLPSDQGLDETPPNPVENYENTHKTPHIEKKHDPPISCWKFGPSPQPCS